MKTRLISSRDIVTRGGSTKGRFTGEDNHNSKLTWENICEITHKHDVLKISQRKLAKEYGVIHSTIGYIVRRDKWRNINYE